MLLRWSCLPLAVLALSACGGGGGDGSDAGPVDSGPIVKLPPSIDSFLASPAGVRPSETSTITYRTANATNIRIVFDGDGSELLATTDAQGSVVTPPLTVTSHFTIIATDGTITSTRGLEIVVDVRGEDSVAHVAILTATVSTASVAPGGRPLLTWTTKHARSGKIRRLDGDTEIYDIPEAKLEDGVFELRPQETSVYRISFKGIDKQEVSRYIAVSVGVEGEPHGRERFEERIQPVLLSRCAPCHSGAAARGPLFLDGPAEGWYATITADKRFVNRPENSLLFWKGEHAGPGFDDATRTQLVTWLLEETYARRITIGGNPESPLPHTLDEAYSRMHACIDIALWNSTYGSERVNHTSEAAYEVAVGRNGQGGGPCHTCHLFGTGGNTFSPDSATVFREARRVPAINKIFTPTYAINGSFMTFVPANRWVLKGMDLEHPQFELSAQRVNALNALTTLALAKSFNATQRCDDTE